VRALPEDSTTSFGLSAWLRIRLTTGLLQDDNWGKGSSRQGSRKLAK
jgi:hypothetical protein